MFNVYTIVPDYDFRDAVSGHRAYVHPYAFVTEGGALAVARLLGDDEVETVVVPVGASPFDRQARRYHFSGHVTWDDLPF